MKIKIKTGLKYITAMGLFAGIMSSAIAEVQSAYNYRVFRDAIDDARWQRGDNSETRCSGSDCSSTMDSSSNQDYIWTDSSTRILHFSTDGNEDDGWRNELRFVDSFSRGSTRTMTATVGYWAGRSTSSGLTIAQLHMESDDDYDNEGPVARLEIVDEDTFKVVWREGYSCTSNCVERDEYSTSTSGFKDIQLRTSGNVLNVSVQGQTFSYDMDGGDANWPSDGAYYWKAGVYLQREGSAFVGFENLTW